MSCSMHIKRYFFLFSVLVVVDDVAVAAATVVVAVIDSVTFVGIDWFAVDWALVLDS